VEAISRCAGDGSDRHDSHFERLPAFVTAEQRFASARCKRF
jgi:hypothetical protein